MSKKLKLKVSGMHCSSCVALIKTTLENIEGVFSADVNLENASASIEYDEAKANQEVIIKEIASLKYIATE